MKDELLACYLKPYCSKILCTYKPLVYIDCFAGKGKFDDGSYGSPLIALNIIKKSIESTKNNVPQIYAGFIDVNYANELKENIGEVESPNIKVKIVSGKYEENISKLLECKKNCNVFLYIDPYGIMDLNCSKFDEFSRDQFNSIELLINFNSFGFIREGCRALGLEFKAYEGCLNDLDEYNPTVLDASENSVKALDDIAGGDYWQEIIKQLKMREIGGNDAEERFAEKYCKRLRKSYKYVLNMPIRVKKGNHSKYRMIHATNHKEGCLLMVDNIYNRLKPLQRLKTGEQVMLWSEDVNDNQINMKDIEKKFIILFPNMTI